MEPRRDFSHGAVSPADRSTPELMRELVFEGRRLVQQEIRLAKVELKDEAKQLGRNAGIAGAGVFVAVVADLCLTATVILLLDLVMPAWAAALIVTLLNGALAAALIVTGANRLKHFEVKPRETVETLEEDRAWLKNTMRVAKSRRHASA